MEICCDQIFDNTVVKKYHFPVMPLFGFHERCIIIYNICKFLYCLIERFFCPELLENGTFALESAEVLDFILFSAVNPILFVVYEWQD